MRLLVTMHTPSLPGGWPLWSVVGGTNDDPAWTTRKTVLKHMHGKSQQPAAQQGWGTGLTTRVATASVTGRSALRVGFSGAVCHRIGDHGLLQQSVEEHSPGARGAAIEAENVFVKVGVEMPRLN